MEQLASRPGFACSVVVLTLLGCEGNEPASAEHRSKTAGLTQASVTAGDDAGTVRLIAIGDTGEGNETQRAVAVAMNETCKERGCTAVLMLGDNFYDVGVNGADDDQWGHKFERVYDLPYLDGLSFYATLGNHDTGLGCASTSSCSREAQIDYSYLPVGDGPGTRPSSKWVMLDEWYDIRIGHVHLFSVHAQEPSRLQSTEVTERIRLSDATWKIVFAHHPRFTSGRHNLDNRFVDLATGMFEFQQVVYCDADLYLSGHDHDLELIDRGRDAACPDTHFAISGAGSKVRSTRGIVWAEDGPGTKGLFYDDASPGFAYLELTKDRMTISFIDQTGRLLFEHGATK